MEITFYAAAADAAGVRQRHLGGPLTAGEVVAELGAGNPALAGVLARCSLLVDGRVSRDAEAMITDDARVDLLPPFAGG